MLPDEQPVEYILQSLDAEMETQPKVILFDIGGVVVSTLARNVGIDSKSYPLEL